MENKCTGCKTLISPYRTRCYKCQVEYSDAIKDHYEKSQEEDFLYE